MIQSQCDLSISMVSHLSVEVKYTIHLSILIVHMGSARSLAETPLTYIKIFS